MTKQQKTDTISFLEEHYNKLILEAENPFDKSILRRELQMKIEKVENGENVFESEENDSDYECLSCGA